MACFRYGDLRSRVHIGSHPRCVGAQQRRTLRRTCGIFPGASRVRGRWGKPQYDALATLQRARLSRVSCPQPQPWVPASNPYPRAQPRIRSSVLCPHTLWGWRHKRRGAWPRGDRRIPAPPRDRRPRGQSLAPTSVRRPSRPRGSALGWSLGQRALRRRDLPAGLARHRPYPPT